MAELGYYGPGNWLGGLPELGITELFGGEKQSLSDATVRYETGEEPNMSVDPYTQDFGIMDFFGSTPTTSTGGFESGFDSGVVGGGSGGGGGGSISPEDAIRSSSSDLFTSAGYDAGDISRSLGFGSKDEMRAAFPGMTADDILAEASKVGDEILSYANKAESTLRGSQESALGDIGRLMGESVDTAKQQFGEGGALLGQQLSEGGQRRKDALTDAVRLYNELVTGGRQRFGGASSAGDAFSAIAGQQLQRGRQMAATQYGQFAEKIGVARQNLQTKFDTVVRNLESQRVRLVNQANRDFQNNLLEIDRMRAEAGASKTSARLSALQQLRNQQFQIQLATHEAQLAIQAEAQQLNSQLDQALSQISQQSGDPTGINTTYSTDSGAPASAAATAPEQEYVGQISSGYDEEDLFGSLGNVGIGTNAPA